jgi:hypothetical protein
MENIAVIGSVGYPSKQGKIETLVHHLVKELGNKVRFTIYCSTKNFPKSERLKSTFKLKLVYLPFKSKGFQGIIYDSISMIHALFFAKTFLILGVSTAFILPFLRLFTSKKLIISINCIEWKRQKRNRFSRLLLKWSENIAIRWAHSIVTDNDAIKQYLYAEYSVLCERIEYGADHVLNVKPTRSDYKKYPFLSNPYAFKVARIEQENNIYRKEYYSQKERVDKDTINAFETATQVVEKTYPPKDVAQLMTFQKKYGSACDVIGKDICFHFKVYDNEQKETEINYNGQTPLFSATR